MFFFNRSAAAQTNAGYQNLTTDDYAARYFNGQQAHTLVDVRTPEEFASGHIPGAVNIPLNALAARLKDVPADQPVIVVCATGSRSRSAASAFKRAGYAEVYNLQGGTMRWVMQRRPVE